MNISELMDRICMIAFDEDVELEELVVDLEEQEIIKINL